jgi:N-methylhydantoinase B
VKPYFTTVTVRYRASRRRDGDMFLANDPWGGVAHQQDVILICPVFHENELFC